MQVKTLLVREWDNDIFHGKILALESQGYVARRETYTVVAEQNPETGYIVHVYSIEMYQPDAASEDVGVRAAL